MILSWLQDLGSGTRFNNSTVYVRGKRRKEARLPRLWGAGCAEPSPGGRCGGPAPVLAGPQPTPIPFSLTDPMRLCNIKTRLCNVLTVTSNDDTRANIVITHRVIHSEHRLHQMMLADHCLVVTIRCTDRPRLLFDIIYTLIEMDYIVLHGYIKAERTKTFQEYCIRHVDGSAVKSDTERGNVIKCIRAAVWKLEVEDDFV
ncbi:putative ACT domain-containing protein ACR1-12 [Helianthus anomalus]